MITHGMTKTPEYRSWHRMKQRCFNPNEKRYSDYGGRGITVCDRWKNSFEDFFADMECRPSPKHSLDRIDNNSDYSAENCKWSTSRDQANNRRSNHLITIGCVTLTISQWSEEMGFERSVIKGRLRSGWSELEAVTTAIGGKKRSL